MTTVVLPSRLMEDSVVAPELGGVSGGTSRRGIAHRRDFAWPASMVSPQQVLHVLRRLVFLENSTLLTLFRYEQQVSS